ncbi:SH3 domain-containing protein [Pelagovum pacificum]|uniref:Peptide-binding protein n=1 Tax=Pelagovum pacificum TaxID=2588711 RepID=A0A5C5GGY0_9RHOB|nr:SH3 domain-containing protein [Pelagovum pacificum]QQA42850.1 SH3 domain-containing protein [Pelagovum pacificum]TNY34002.1 peptide-binding protein [Pelagovum pacificum]
MIRILFSLFLSLFALPLAAQEYPQLMDVSGVASDDTLNVRTGPGASYPVIGELAFNEMEVEVVRKAPDANWGLVNLGEQAGWVSLNFMRPTAGAQPWYGTPTGITYCGGTEPFWDLQASDGTATVSNMGEPMFSGPAQPFVGSVNGPARASALSIDGGGMAALTVVPGACNDGMSEMEFGLSAYLVFQQPGQNFQLWQGCCSVAP